MKISEVLSKETKDELNKIHSRKEKLSERDVKELMGMSRSVYKKVKGRVRQQ